MKKMILTSLTISLLSLSAQASRILDCTTLGGKSVKITYGFNGSNTVLEDLSLDGQSAVGLAASFSFTRSGMNLTLKNGTVIVESNGTISQKAASGEFKSIQCSVSDTAEKKITKEF